MQRCGTDALFGVCWRQVELGGRGGHEGGGARGRGDRRADEVPAGRGPGPHAGAGQAAAFFA